VHQARDVGDRLLAVAQREWPVVQRRLAGALV